MQGHIHVYADVKKPTCSPEEKAEDYHDIYFLLHYMHV